MYHSTGTHAVPVAGAGGVPDRPVRPRRAAAAGGRPLHGEAELHADDLGPDRGRPQPRPGRTRSPRSGHPKSDVKKYLVEVSTSNATGADGSFSGTLVDQIIDRDAERRPHHARPRDAARALHERRDALLARRRRGRLGQPRRVHHHRDVRAPDEDRRRECDQLSRARADDDDHRHRRRTRRATRFAASPIKVSGDGVTATSKKSVSGKVTFKLKPKKVRRHRHLHRHEVRSPDRHAHPAGVLIRRGCGRTPSLFGRGPGRAAPAGGEGSRPRRREPADEHGQQGEDGDRDHEAGADDHAADHRGCGIAATVLPPSTGRSHAPAARAGGPPRGRRSRSSTWMCGFAGRSAAPGSPPSAARRSAARSGRGSCPSTVWARRISWRRARCWDWRLPRRASRFTNCWVTSWPTTLSSVGRPRCSTAIERREEPAHGHAHDELAVVDARSRRRAAADEAAELRGDGGRRVHDAAEAGRADAQIEAGGLDHRRADRAARCAAAPSAWRDVPGRPAPGDRGPAARRRGARERPPSARPPAPDPSPPGRCRRRTPTRRRTRPPRRRGPRAPPPPKPFPPPVASRSSHPSAVDEDQTASRRGEFPEAAAIARSTAARSGPQTNSHSVLRRCETVPTRSPAGLWIPIWAPT